MSEKNKDIQTANISNPTKKKVSVSQAISSTKDNTKRWFWICIAVLSVSVIIVFLGGFDDKFVEIKVWQS